MSLSVCLVLFAGSVAPVLACRRHHRSYARYSYGYQPRYRRAAYYRAFPNRTYYAYSPRRSFWQRHRDSLTPAIGTSGGTAVRAVLGGTKGAGIRALTCLPASAI